jgi:hypothetical protein
MPHNVYTGDEEGRVVRHSFFLSFLPFPYAVAEENTNRFISLETQANKTS